MRPRWPLVVLLASIGLTALAALEAQRNVRSQRQVAARALRDYASFAAWSYAQRVVDTIGLVEREIIGAVNHGDNMHTSMRVPRAEDLEHYLPHSMDCMCPRPRVGPMPDAFFAVQIGRSDLDAAEPGRMGMEMEMDHARGVRLTGSTVPLFSPAESRWTVDSLTRRVRGLGQVDHGYNLIVGDVAGRPNILTYTLMPTSWGDTMVYGARYSPAAFTGLLEGVLDGNGLLPATFTAGRKNRDVLAVRVSDHAGHVLFESAHGVTSDLEAHLELPPRAGQLTIDAVIRPELAGALIIGGLPRSRLPFLMGLLALAAALSIVAVMQIRREGELARLQSGFVSSVSHELRTPLAQIRLYLETLQLGRAATEEQRQWSLQHIDRETKRLSHLVENVLRFSIVGAGSAAHREPVDVASEAAAIVEEFRPLAASRRASIHFEASAAPLVMLAPDALRHILLNLLDNAVKYGPQDQTVVVAVREENGFVTLTVDDEGPGVSEREREHVWRPFTRGGASTHTGGSGIGLTIVRDAAVAHGGAVRVERSPRGGARFIVAFPAASVSTAPV